MITAVNAGRNRIVIVCIKALACLWLALAAISASAMLPAAPEETPAEETAPAPTIEAQVDPGDDARITSRLRGIFRAADAFADVSVSADEGVVTLGGTVDTPEDIEEAEKLARQVRGVVTVQNDIERDLSVGKNLNALAKLSKLATDALAMLPLIAAALIVAFAIGLIGHVIASFSRLWRRIAPNVFLAELIASAIRFVFIIFGLVIALDMIGAGALLGAVLGGAGVIGVALGFAMRDTIENYVASLMLSLRQPFRANDHVLIDDLEGRIIRLTSRATVMMTLDGNHMRIPNSTVFKATILNYTTNPNRRFEFELGIDADDDPNAARRLGRNTLGALPFVLARPAPEARAEQVGDSNIVIKYLAWIDQREADWFKARSRAIAAVKMALEDAGFGLPEPIYRLRFDERTMPLPFENIERKAESSSDSTGGQTARIDEDADREASKAATKSRPAEPADTHEDVKPEDEIAMMVEAERAADPGGDDLLDHSRPPE
ncbi:MAG: mechanosensitive ion channel family protein [Pontixanthobacter sp.]